MIYFGIIVGLVILVAMVYMALNKRSEFPIRVASLIALAVMIIAIIVCFSLIFSGTISFQDESVVIVGYVPEAPVEKGNNTLLLMIMVVFLVAFFILIAVLALRDHRRKHGIHK